METQKTLNSQNSLEKEDWSWRNHFPDFRLYYKASHQDRMVLAQKQKYRPMEQDSSEINHAPMGTLFLTKEARIYNGEKTDSSINGAGKTGEVHVK